MCLQTSRGNVTPQMCLQTSIGILLRRYVCVRPEEYYYVDVFADTQWNVTPQMRLQTAIRILLRRCVCERPEEYYSVDISRRLCYSVVQISLQQNFAYLAFWRIVTLSKNFRRSIALHRGILLCGLDLVLIELCNISLLGEYYSIDKCLSQQNCTQKTFTPQFIFCLNRLYSVVRFWLNRAVHTQVQPSGGILLRNTDIASI